MKRFMPVLPAVMLILLMLLIPPLSSYLPVAWAQEQYLLMQPISKGIYSGNFSSFKEVCRPKISVNFEPPFELTGYIDTEKFIQDFSDSFSRFKTLELEWSSKQIEIPFAVQSLNLILKNKRSDKTVYYKFIFFMIKSDQKWQIYHLRGLSI
jgi:hypothetical protein